MGNRESNGRYAAARTQVQGAREAVQSPGMGSYGEAVSLSPDRQKVLDANEVIKAEHHHSQMVREGMAMLESNQPFIHTVFERLSGGLYKWFKHQGFWPQHWPVDELEGVQMFGFSSPGTLDPEQLRLKKMEKLGLIMTEVAEAMEAVRKNDDQNEREELSDALVRIFDYVGGFGHANLIGEAFIGKMQKNYERPFRHGKQF